MGFIIWIIAFVATAIGKILAEFLVSLELFDLPELISAIVWFLISFVTYLAGRKIEGEGWFKLLSLNFIVTWAFCTFGVLLGAVIWELIVTGGVVLQLEVILAIFFGSLPLTIGPTASLSLGLRDQ